MARNVNQANEQAVAIRDPLPDPIAQEIQQPYILNGLTYQSNNPYVIERDDAGNIKLYESGSNQRLIIEPSIENITNQSFVQVVDTQFQYFKFPVKTVSAGSSALTDIDLDISQDPYEGRLIRTDSSNTYLIENGLKRLFFIKADNTWALKNNLPPFSNIADNIDNVDPGGYNPDSSLNVEKVPETILGSYPIGTEYLPTDAFPEGNVYSKFTFILEEKADNTDASLLITGPGFGKAKFDGFVTTNDGDVIRVMEFNINDTANSYLEFSMPDLGGARKMTLGVGGFLATEFRLIADLLENSENGNTSNNQEKPIKNKTWKLSISDLLNYNKDILQAAFDFNTNKVPFRIKGNATIQFTLKILKDE